MRSIANTYSCLRIINWGDLRLWVRRAPNHHTGAHWNSKIVSINRRAAHIAITGATGLSGGTQRICSEIYLFWSGRHLAGIESEQITGQICQLWNFSEDKFNNFITKLHPCPLWVFVLGDFVLLPCWHIRTAISEISQQWHRWVPLITHSSTIHIFVVTTTLVLPLITSTYYNSNYYLDILFNFLKS